MSDDPVLSSRLTPAALALLALCSAHGVRAAGFWNLERGPSNFGRGGANYADPDDPIAIFTNPAALAGLRGLQLNIDINAVYDQRRFERSNDTFGRREYRYDPVTNVADPFQPSPGLFATYNFGALDLPALSVGFAVYGPPASPVIWSQSEGGCRLPRPETCSAAQRYSQLDRSNAQIQYALAVAYELPWFQLRLGANLMLIDQVLTTSFKLNAPLFEDPNNPENPEFDIRVAANAKVNAVPCAIFAASGRPFDWLVLAVSFQLPYTVHAAGTAEIELSEVYQQIAVVEGSVVGLELNMPALFRAAVQYDDPAGLFDIELVLVWEQWSRNQEIIITPVGVSLTPVNTAGEPIESMRKAIRRSCSITAGVTAGACGSAVSWCWCRICFWSGSAASGRSHRCPFEGPWPASLTSTSWGSPWARGSTCRSAPGSVFPLTPGSISPLAMSGGSRGS